MAQREKPAPGREKRETRELYLQAVLNEIKNNLKLSDAQMNLFKPIFMEYKQELRTASKDPQRHLSLVQIDSLSTAQANDILGNRIKIAYTILSVQEKYNTRFLTVLSPQQLLQFYYMEANVRRKMVNESNKRDRIRD